ncbi:MAG: serine/threonine protein kinase, partial [Planctomycetes bacterium]|nr:serine/threonine protein kinase [Planctomycetota bacterium]
MLDREYGTYRLIRRLGRGGMADVYLARDTDRQRDVALKLVELKDDRDSRDIYDAERRGALLQKQFSGVDAHVPAVHACGTRDGFFYIDMEYVDGEDLAERVARGPMPAADAAQIGRELCDFLDKSHRFEATVDEVQVRGIIHGDIKPKNIRLNRQGQVKVLDFGIAKGLALSRKLTRNDFGSLAYLSPERLDSGEVDAQVDCWSIGVLLYEMVAGTPPFDADSNPKLEWLIRSRRPPPPLPDGCPSALARIISKTLAGDLAARYPDAGAIRDDLAAFISGAETAAEREWQTALVAGEATRRTTGAASPGPAPETDTEVTRRTQPVDAGAGSAAVPRLVVQRRPPGRTRRMAMVVLLIAGAGVMGNEVSVWSAARQLRVDLATQQAAELPGIWGRYQTLSRRCLLGIGLAGVRGPLRERLISQADKVIADYRQDAPAVREAQWRDAATWLSNVLYLNPTDRIATARLRYCEGHLERINGEARKRKKLAAAQPLHDAVVKFEEAAKLDGGWPDPYLGLARTYVYGLDDLDKAIAAFKEAESRGYRPGNRELVQLADGYRSRADRMRRQSADVRNLPQEREYLQKAADDYRQALD